MFLKNKFYEIQNATTQAWLNRQSLWTDCDLMMSFGIGLLIGNLMGLTITLFIL